MRRTILIAALVAGLPLGGCAGVPAAVIWTTVGAGLGFGASALKLDDDLLQLYERDHPPEVTAP